MENEINNLVVQEYISNEEIKNLIYTIRGKQVMLDSDVAMLYHYTTKNINKAVKRNIDRFPEDFCFQLTESEFQDLRFQFGTLNRKVNNGDVTRKYLPYVFTEQGISMLSGVLKMLTKKNKNVEVVILTSEKGNIQKIDIRKFNKEYPILKVAKTNKFHDRFIVIDDKEMYHLGASIKDLGKKCFGINKIEDVHIIKQVINL